MSVDKERLGQLKRFAQLSTLRSSFQGALSGAGWWFYPTTSSLKRSLSQAEELSAHFFEDARSRQGRSRSLLTVLSKGIGRQSGAFAVLGGSHKGVWIVPLKVADRSLGFLALTGTDGLDVRILKLLEAAALLACEGFWGAEEISRLTATIRPRAIALSTVHTVHRIINSTLNLDELVSRLAHLTAQVLRVNRCAIHLLDRSGKDSAKRMRLVCKALVGYPYKVDGARAVGPSSLEGKVVRSADIQLRKKVLCIPLIDEDVIGVVTVIGKKDKKDFNQFDLEILTTLAEEAVIAIKNAQLYEEQRRVTLSSIRSLAVILGSRFPSQTGLSVESFADLATCTAKELGLNDEQTQAIHYAALLKETARLGIPEDILSKPDKLTGEEFSRLKSHTLQGAKMIQNFESLKSVAPIILYSREKFDGTGYPEGLKGEAIPIGSRVLSVLNAFEAIVIGRPYRGRVAAEADVIRELQQNSGTQFDPRVVDAFLRALKKDNRYIRLVQDGGR